jgi:WD40 repeat protein
LDSWKEGKVQPTTHEIKVLPAKKAAKSLPVSEHLVATLPHPDRNAGIHNISYSADGKQLFVTGYPSGILQIFDVEKKKEVRRLDTPKGYRGSADYAQRTPGGKMVYIGDERKRKVVPVEIMGKKDHRIEYSGHVLTWDLTTGEPQESLPPEKDHGVSYLKLSPSGEYLLVIETRTHLASQRDEEQRTSYVWNLKTRKKTKLGEGFLIPSFLPDGKTVLVVHSDHNAKTSVLQRRDLATGKVLVSKDSPVKGLDLSVIDLSGDGKRVAITMGGKKGIKQEIRFLDTTTFEEVGSLISEGDPDSFGWGNGKFSPNGKLFYTTDGAGNTILWDVEAKRVVRVFKGESRHPARSPQFTSDGNWLIVGWMPKLDTGRMREPDPTDLPQPRVTLFPLKDQKAEPITLIAPHGYVGGLAIRPDGKQFAFGGAGGVHLFDLNGAIEKAKASK